MDSAARSSVLILGSGRCRRLSKGPSHSDERRRFDENRGKMDVSLDHNIFMEAFGALPGVLPDGIIVGSSPSDWPRVLTALGQAGWHAVWTSNGRTVEVADFANDAYLHESFAVRPINRATVNFFFGVGEITFDFDLRELVDQAAVDALCSLLAMVGNALNRQVDVTPEGQAETIVVRYLPGGRRFVIDGIASA